MPTRIALFVLLALGIISGAELSSLMLAVSPYDATRAELWLFFVSFFICSSVVLGFIWYGIRRLRPRRTTKLPLWPHIRQAALLSLVITLSLFFSSLGIFHTWNIIPLAAAAILIEFFFQAEKKPHATIKYESDDAS